MSVVKMTSIYDDTGDVAPVLSSLLNHVGFTDDSVWMANVVDILSCDENDEVVNFQKFFFDRLQCSVKPSHDSDYCFLVDLMVPSGCASNKIFRQLKDAENRFNIGLKKTLADSVVIQTIPVVTSEEKHVFSDDTTDLSEMKTAKGKKTLKGLLKDKKLLRDVLLVISQETGKHTYSESFRKAVIDRCNWGDCARNAISRAFTEMEKADLISTNINEANRNIGYILTAEGQKLLVDSDMIPIKPKCGNIALLERVLPNLKLLQEMHARITANQAEQKELRKQKAEIIQRLEALEEESEALQKKLEDPKLESSLIRLEQYKES